MLGCGEPDNGYAKYICPKCLETKIVPLQNGIKDSSKKDSLKGQNGK